MSPDIYRGISFDNKDKGDSLDERRKIIVGLVSETSRLVGENGATPLFKDLLSDLVARSKSGKTLVHSERVAVFMNSLNRRFYRLPSALASVLGLLHDVGKGHNRDYLDLMESNKVIDGTTLDNVRLHLEYSSERLGKEGLFFLSRTIRGHHAWGQLNPYPLDYENTESGIIKELALGLAISDKEAASTEKSRVRSSDSSIIYGPNKSRKVLKTSFPDEVGPQIDFIDNVLTDGRFTDLVNNPPDFLNVNYQELFKPQELTIFTKSINL